MVGFNRNNRQWIAEVAGFSRSQEYNRPKEANFPLLKEDSEKETSQLKEVNSRSSQCPKKDNSKDSRIKDKQIRDSQCENNGSPEKDDHRKMVDSKGSFLGKARQKVNFRVKE
ncbi:MAG: hypothetical protein Q8P03_01610 [bacterium]|nr:hypothetical protein [bacterium]